MPNEDSSEVIDETAECLSEAHAAYMEEYIRREDEAGQKAIERFLAAVERKRSTDQCDKSHSGKLRQQGKAYQAAKEL